jgi:group I intron endonuclease
MITYTAPNTRTGQFYIGSTTNFKKRQQEHLSSKAALPFQRALRKKPDEWEWEFIEDDRKDRELEQLLLDLFWGTEGCLNLAADATSPTKGRKQTPETKAKIGAKHKGKKYGSETRAKISKATKGHTRLKGRSFPGRNSGVANSQSKKVEVTFPSGEKKVFEFGKQAAAEIGCPPSTLHDFARTGTAPSPKGKWAGYSFQYV